MADQPIGVSFIPTAANAQLGPMQSRVEGAMPGVSGSTDLAQAYKVLSLRLPQVLGAAAPTPQANLTSQGAAGLPNLPSGLSPYAALFAALLKAQLGLPSSSSSMPDLSSLFGAGATSTGSPGSSATDTLGGLIGAGTPASGSPGTPGGEPPVTTPRPKVILGGGDRPGDTGAADASAGDSPAPVTENRDFSFY